MGDTKKDRRAVYDIYCTTEDGTFFIVEMQKAFQAYFNSYNESLKNYRDMHSIVQSAVDKAVDKKIKETIIRSLNRAKATIQEIAEDNDVSIETVLAIQQAVENE
jgi:hypothetical protein